MTLLLILCILQQNFIPTGSNIFGREYYWTFPLDLEKFNNEQYKLSYFNDTGECDLCNFTVRNEKNNSSPRDLLLAATRYKLENIHFLVRSLRHTGSKCTVAYLLDTIAYHRITAKDRFYLEKCGVQLINMGDAEYTNKTDVWSSMYLWMEYVIYSNPHKFDRILKVDMYDVIFQGDPFDKSIKPDTFYMISEAGPIGKHSMSKEFIAQVDDIIPHPSKYLEGKYFLSSGVAFGTEDVFLKSLNAFFTLWKWSRGWDDQSVFNAAIYSGIFDYYKIKTETLRKSEYVYHMWYTQTPIHRLGNVTSKFDRSYAHIIHNSYLSGILLYESEIYCPKDDPELRYFYTKDRFLCKTEDFMLTCIDHNYNEDGTLIELNFG
ncbi:hypothetical protein TVAG_459110 [Trichomonas vaginalis G3]|uniref:Uncharacterized protein n=1 Tax=Trichomonas vaginalis (strain ATCC PRA-98 / G3) TaxID=412133 RepID=A2E6B6_TRIV3|nr:hypothetical protein TVAGG3_0394760 [Trichomonas vaginalis G3]EAY11839.1 hypothetical protein TVAG_459110 [Trichomonas vaginalis G3]KAI5534257.1 hypothetical protein TVAGG3_0394760 [Trichomonas vaginalis G3]|eukprot:XP_001324062.1 hypothetical protein [Trichomonas vaginalis G3]